MTETRKSASPAFNGTGGAAAPSHSYQYQNHQHQGATPRPHNALYGTANRGPPANANNLSELDTLLQDLSIGRYDGTLDKKGKTSRISLNLTFHITNLHSTEAAMPVAYGISQVKQQPGSNYSTLSSTTKRPTVDSLLDELTNASTNSIYAVPNG